MLVWLLSLSFGLIAVLCTGYLLLLTVLSFGARPAAAGGGRTRFTVVIPAHDEEDGIAATVHSLQATSYPEERRAILVVADNCTDATAARARAAGARVLERTDPERRGKGYALEMAFATLVAEDACDAIVVVDADTAVSANLLAAFDARVAAGERAVQARYGVRNVDASWRTRLMAVAFGMFHDLRSLGRERLRLSCGLRGNGMCFTLDLVRAHPHRAHGLVEDVEYGIELGLAGVRVCYAGEAEVRGDMAATGRAAATQRQRWEGGRAALRRQYLGRLLRAAPRSAVAADLAADLLVPPLSRIGVLVAGGLLLEAAAWAAGGATAAAPLWLASAAALGAYAVRGAALSGLGTLRGLVTLAAAPAYVVWKTVAVKRGAAATWVRTAREKPEA